MCRFERLQKTSGALSAFTVHLARSSCWCWTFAKGAKLIKFPTSWKLQRVRSSNLEPLQAVDEQRYGSVIFHASCTCRLEWKWFKDLNNLILQSNIISENQSLAKVETERRKSFEIHHQTLTFNFDTFPVCVDQMCAIRVCSVRIVACREKLAAFWFCSSCCWTGEQL